MSDKNAVCEAHQERQLTASEERIYDMANIIYGHFVGYGSVESCDRRDGGKIAVELARYEKANYRRRVRHRFADDVFIAVQLAEDALFPERSMCAACLAKTSDVKAKRLAAKGYG